MALDNKDVLTEQQCQEHLGSLVRYADGLALIRPGHNAHEPLLGDACKHYYALIRDERGLDLVAERIVGSNDPELLRLRDCCAQYLQVKNGTREGTYQALFDAMLPAGNPRELYLAMRNAP